MATRDATRQDGSKARQQSDQTPEPPHMAIKNVRRFRTPRMWGSKANCDDGLSTVFLTPRMWGSDRSSHGNRRTFAAPHPRGSKGHEDDGSVVSEGSFGGSHPSRRTNPSSWRQTRQSSPRATPDGGRSLN